MDEIIDWISFETYESVKRGNEEHKVMENYSLQPSCRRRQMNE